MTMERLKFPTLAPHILCDLQTGKVRPRKNLGIALSQSLAGLIVRHRSGCWAQVRPQALTARSKTSRPVGAEVTRLKFLRKNSDCSEPPHVGSYFLTGR